MSAMLIAQFLILTFVISGVIIFFLKKILFESAEGAVQRLNRETEEVRVKQSELNEKIKLASEELNKRRMEADALVAKMKEDAHTQAMEEREKIIKKARADGDEIINKAQRTKEEMRKVIELEMHVKSVDVAVFLLNEILMEKVWGNFDEIFINEFFDRLQELDMGIIDSEIDTVEIMTASPLKEVLKSRLEEILKKKLERPIKMQIIEDRKLICGIVLKFGSLSLNGTLANQMKEKGIELKEKVEKGLVQI